MEIVGNKSILNTRFGFSSKTLYGCMQGLYYDDIHGNIKEIKTRHNYNKQIKVNS